MTLLYDGVAQLDQPPLGSVDAPGVGDDLGRVDREHRCHPCHVVVG